MKGNLSYAYVFLPVAFLLKDIVATMVVLSNEPGITAKNVIHYHLALLPGSILFGATGWTWLVNICVGLLAGLGISYWTRRRSQRREPLG